MATRISPSSASLLSSVNVPALTIVSLAGTGENGTLLSFDIGYLPDIVLLVSLEQINTPWSDGVPGLTQQVATLYAPIAC